MIKKISNPKNFPWGVERRVHNTISYTLQVGLLLRYYVTGFNAYEGRFLRGIEGNDYGGGRKEAKQRSPMTIRQT